MKKALVALAMAALASTAMANIAGSKHDLHVGWNGLTPRGSAPLAACTYCHAPHSANTVAPYTVAPLWNRKATAAIFDTKSTIAGTTPSLTQASAGHSLTCLTCHDGVSDVGATFASGDAYTTTGNKIPVGGTAASPGSNVGSTYNGTTYVAAAAGHADLRDDHPVGIPYPANGTANFIDSGVVQGTLKLYDNGTTLTVECASCHEPHSTAFGKFLRAPADTLCAVCHDK
jgi:predicted CXXCH cytochrome family protein